MNTEKLRFVKGGTVARVTADDPPSFEAQIDVIGEEVWLARICVYGYNPENAEGLRDRVLWGLEQPTVPAQWQYKSKLDWGPEGDPDNVWIDLDNGGEAARLKGEGYEIRALYAKVPLPEAQP
jgi:hypothetical protein